MNLERLFIIFFLLLTFSCKRTSENVIEEYIKIISEYKQHGEQNPYEHTVDKINFSKNRDSYKLKIQDTSFHVIKIKDHNKQITGVALSLDQIDERLLLSLLNQKLGVSSGVNIFGQPLWKLPNGIIYLQKKYLCFRIGNEFDYAEIKNYPKMPSSNEIDRFVGDHNLYNPHYSKKKLNVCYKTLIEQQFTDSLINVDGNNILSSFYTCPGITLTYMIHLFIPYLDSPKDELDEVAKQYSVLFGSQSDVFAPILQDSILDNIISYKKSVIKESNLVFIIKANKDRKTRLDMSIWRREVFHGCNP